MKRKKIPVHIDELVNVDVAIQLLHIDPTLTHLLTAHRDDHYIFMLQQKGSLQLILDFKSITLKNTCLLFIKPGQVHYYLPRKTEGWLLEVRPNIIEKDFRDYLDKLISQFIPINDSSKLTSILKLVNKTSSLYKLNNFQKKEIQSYVNAFVAIVCAAFNSIEEKNTNPQSRLNQITSTFHKLLTDNFRTYKKPAEYARLLHISTSYLNETLIKTTGFSTTYWIQQQLFLEAKRLLHHTELTAKEIAFEIGFEDHTYFARLFKKVNGLTPLDFRKAYRDLSN